MRMLKITRCFRAGLYGLPLKNFYTNCKEFEPLLSIPDFFHDKRTKLFPFSRRSDKATTLSSTSRALSPSKRDAFSEGSMCVEPLHDVSLAEGDAQVESSKSALCTPSRNAVLTPIKFLGASAIMLSTTDNELKWRVLRPVFFFEQIVSLFRTSVWNELQRILTFF